MVKVCPFRIMGQRQIVDYTQFECVEDHCEWWVANHYGGSCVLKAILETMGEE